MVKNSDNGQDPRTQRTIYLLREAIKELLKTNKIEDISIQDISTKAMIYRTTFYSHYSDKYELLEDYLLEMWKKEVLITKISDTRSFDQNSFWNGMQQTVDYFKKYSDLYLQLLEEKPSLLFESNIIFRTIKKYFILYLDLIQPDHSKPIISIDRIADFYCSGFLNVTLHWLQKGCQEPSYVLTKELVTLTEHNLKSILGFQTTS